MTPGGLAIDYSPESLLRIKATCLTVAQILGEDMLRDDVVIVGGLVPSLLYPDAEPHPVLGAHVGTNDLDIALDLVILNDQRYEDITERLRRGGFAPDTKEDGAIVRQRWRSSEGTLIDFLVALNPPEGPRKPELQSFNAEFAAIRTLGLDLALSLKETASLAGLDLRGRQYSAALPVCRADVFIMLKAIAMSEREKNKDAYDLYFALEHVEGGPAGVGASLREIGAHPALKKMDANLGKYFQTIDSPGPRRVAAFVGEPENNDLAADVLASVKELLAAYHGQ